MSRTVTAVVLSLLMPGLGQLYNREKGLGWAVIGVTTVLILVPSVWLVRQAAPFLQSADPLEIQTLMAKVVLENKHMLNLISFSFLGLWAYSITQAYFKAKEISETGPDGETKI